MKFLDCRKEPFRIYGVFYEKKRFRRIPEKVAKAVSKDVEALHTNTAGGRVRFVTDSKTIAIRAVMDGIGRMPHFALSGSAGFDLYECDREGKEIFRGTFIPPYDFQDGFEGTLEFETAEQRILTIHFPLYSNLISLKIGISKDAELTAAPDYRLEQPIVYYGSSITQGGCATRPGMAYENLISRKYKCNHINLGFSGSCKAEMPMAEYISGLSMSAFVFDYDHNAPTVEYLLETHERFYQYIRQARPELPIILVSRPKYSLTKDDVKRRSVIRRTYRNALAQNDQNIYFLDGQKLMNAFVGEEGTVDLCHPTDAGFLSMANVMGNALHKIGIV